MEQLLHYCWKHKLFPLKALTTTTGESLEIIDTGLHNRNAGPDFFNAKVVVGGMLWVGNVEIHCKSSDWYQHQHHKDSAYNNVVLHVCEQADCDVVTADGRTLPQLEIAVPQYVADNYKSLLETDHYPPCYKIIPQLSSLTVHAWMSALQTERLEQKTKAIEQRVSLCGGSWEDAYFQTLARNYGFGVNGEAFEMWARTINLNTLAHHRDNEFQIEALFMGQAGLLQPESIPERYRDQALQDGYFQKLRQEYAYLSHKFSMKPMNFSLWKFLRMRPQNFPHIRISQLSRLYYEQKSGLSKLLECTSVEQLEQLLNTSVSPYWETHYTFGASSAKISKHLSANSLRLIIINTAIPMFFAYGRYKNNEQLCDLAFNFLEQLKAENNHIIRMWAECGMPISSAGDSQALIQLKNNYCDRRDCLRCRIGYHYLKTSTLNNTPPQSTDLRS